jgi:hypothetical protein
MPSKIRAWSADTLPPVFEKGFKRGIIKIA